MDKKKKHWTRKKKTGRMRRLWLKETRTGKKIKKLLSFKLSSFFILRRRSRIGRATDAEL